MKYLGGKAKLANEFSNVFNSALDERKGYFYEPFVGGFNIVPAIYTNINNAICSDVHYGLITLYKAMQRGYIPPDVITEDQYQEAKQTKDWEDPKTAFIAFGCSFGGKEWGGYARGKKPNGESRNYAAEAKRLLMKKAVYMTDNVLFKQQCYTEIMPSNTVIYCDPPYKETTGYKSGVIDYDEFFSWCEQAAKNNCTVFVSEFTKPNRDGWDIVFERERKVSVTGKKQHSKVNKELLLKVSL